MDDLISRQAAINAIENTDCELSADAWDELTDAIMQLPSAQPDIFLVTWLLDEVWDEDLWELNCRSFPEVLCRRLVRYGYLKVEDGKYVRLDKQTGGD